MNGGVVADRLRPPGFVPFPKHQRHTWQLWFVRSPTLWRSIPETTQLPAGHEKKTAERRSVVAAQDLTAELATACVQRSSFDNCANPREAQRVLDVPLLALRSVRGRRDRRHPRPARQPHPCIGPQTCARCRRRRRSPPKYRVPRYRHYEARCVAPPRYARWYAAWDPDR